MKTLPKKINATRAVTYDVSKIIEDIIENDENKTIEDITLEDVMNYVDEWATEDLGSAYRTIYYTDQYGQEISK